MGRRGAVRIVRTAWILTLGHCRIKQHEVCKKKPKERTPASIDGEGGELARSAFRSDRWFLAQSVLVAVQKCVVNLRQGIATASAVYWPRVAVKTEAALMRLMLSCALKNTRIVIA